MSAPPLIATQSTPRPTQQRVGGLDALRGIAVLAVFGYHLGWSWLPGGFLGVDLFFVLSGFLITTILIQSPAELSMRTALSGFFQRRFRRLLPALLLLLTVVAAWAAWVAIPEQIERLRAQGLGTLFSVANWVFISEDISYADAFSDPSVLQHTWSLAIEEQFYLLWPLVVLVVVVRKARMHLLFVSTAFAAAASAGYMWWLAGGDELNTAYLSTLARAHEILIGALGALGIALWSARRHRRAKVRKPVSPALVTTALVGFGLAITALMLTLSITELPYYRGGSVVFSLAVIGVIIMLVLFRPGGGMLLRQPALRWVGGISYGLYLWHWPIIVWLTPASTPFSGLTLDAVRIGLSFGLASASYYLLEMPIRRGGWAHLTVSAVNFWRGLVVAVIAVAMALIAATAGASALAQDDNVALPESSSSATDSVILLVGDSVPKELADAVERVAEERGMTLVPLAFGGCSVTGLFQVDDDGSAFPWSKRCTEVAALQQQAVEKFDPDLIVWSSNRERYGVRTDTGEVLANNTDAHDQAMTASIADSVARLTSTGSQLIIVQPVFKAAAIVGRCATEPDSTECAQDGAMIDSFDWLRATYAAIAEQDTAVSTLSVDDLLCPSGPPCSATEHDGEVIRPDGVHVAQSVEAWFSELLLDRLVAQSTLRP